MISENNCIPVDSYDLYLQIRVRDSDMFGIDVQALWLTLLVLCHMCSGTCVIVSVR